VAQPADVKWDATLPERYRRRPVVDLSYADGLQLLAAKAYTGPVAVHVHQGVPKRIVLPNPEGWS